MAQSLRANMTWAEYGFAPDDKTLAAKKLKKWKNSFVSLPFSGKSMESSWDCSLYIVPTNPMIPALMMISVNSVGSHDSDN